MHLAAKMYKKRGFLCIQGVRCKKRAIFVAVGTFAVGVLFLPCALAVGAICVAVFFWCISSDCFSFVWFLCVHSAVFVLLHCVFISFSEFWVLVFLCAFIALPSPLSIAFLYPFRRLIVVRKLRHLPLEVRFAAITSAWFFASGISAGVERV